MSEFPEELIERCATAVEKEYGGRYGDISSIVLRESGLSELVEALKLARPYVHADDAVGYARAWATLEQIDVALKKAGAL